MSDQPEALVARSKNVRYLPGVDHLRGLAAVLMVVYHGVQQIGHPQHPFPLAHNPLSALVIEGHTAVALFMVLSGFILTFGADRAAVRYGGFMKNRVLRVVPMYVIVLVIGAYTFPGHYSFSGFLQYFTLQATAPLTSPEFGPFSAVLWTISVEFAFYLVFPFLLRFLQRYGVRYLLGLLLLANVLRALAGASNPATIGLTSYFTIVGRIDQFVLGMLAAWLMRRGVLNLSGVRALAVTLAGLVGITMALWFYNRHGSFLGVARWKAHWPIVEGLAWALVVVGWVSFTEGRRGRVVRWLTLPGVVSYSAYLLHYPIVVAVRDRGWHLVGHGSLNAAALTVVFILPVTFAVATLAYLVIERPFMELRVRYLDSTASISETAPT
jgi:peptidoglycan/LPS O-acetylase OafA/YrhL